MTGFMLKNGDLSITNHEIDMIEDDELTIQTIQFVLSTNKGEWMFDTDEGIDFSGILGKQKVKTAIPSDSFYFKQYATLKEDTNSLTERLRKRLDGE